MPTVTRCRRPPRGDDRAAATATMSLHPCSRDGRRNWRRAQAMECGRRAGPASGTAGADPDTVSALRRVASDAIEARIGAILTRLLPGASGDPLQIPLRIELHPGALHILLPASVRATVEAHLIAGESLMQDAGHRDICGWPVRSGLHRRGGRTDVDGDFKGWSALRSDPAAGAARRPCHGRPRCQRPAAGRRRASLTASAAADPAGVPLAGHPAVHSRWPPATGLDPCAIDRGGDPALLGCAGADVRAPRGLRLT